MPPRLTRRLAGVAAVLLVGLLAPAASARSLARSPSSSTSSGAPLAGAARPNTTFDYFLFVR